MSIWWKLYLVLYLVKLAVRVQYYARLSVNDDPRPFFLKTFGHLIVKDWTGAAERVSCLLIAALDLPLMYLLVRMVFS